MEEDFSVVSSKKARGKKQPISESSRLLNLLYSEGLRLQDLDADCRLLLGGSPEDVKAKALAHFVDRHRDGVINKPSAFLTKALFNASQNHLPAKNANSAVLTRETSVCPSALHLLGVLAKEGLRSYDLDVQCQAYLSRTQPAIQTQALQAFLVQWRTGNIKNPSAYLTDLLAKSYRDTTWDESDSLHFMDAPASITTKPRKVAVPVVAPLPFVPASTVDIGVLAAHVKTHAIATAPGFDHRPEHDLSSSWPAVGATDTPLIDTAKPKPVQENRVHDTIMRHFAKQFIPMDRHELQALKMDDLEIILKLLGEAGIDAAIEQAFESAKMMPLYDISDEAGQTELLLKELEYAAQVIVDKLEQDGKLSA